MRREDGVTAAINKAKHVIVHNFLAESDTAGAKNATLVIEGDARSQLHRLRLFDLIFEESRIGRAILDAELLQLAFPGLIANRAIERMIDEQKLHHSALAFLHQWRIRAHAHPFAHFLRARDLRTRHPVDHWFAVRAQLWFAVGPESRHGHLDQTHPAIARRAELLVITIARHKNSSLRARLNHARALRKLMPHAVDLDVEQGNGFVRHL